MHILIIPSWYPAHPGDLKGCFFREQALALKKYGLQVGVIDVQLHSLKVWKYLVSGPFGIGAEFDEGMPTLRFNSMNWFARMSRPTRWLWLRYGMKLFERYVSLYGMPDLVHAHSMLNGGILAKNISEKTGVPFIVTEHNSGYACGLLSQQQLELAKEVAAIAARRFAVSGELSKILEHQFDDAAFPWEEMPNIVEQKFVNAKLPKQYSKIERFSFLNVSTLAEVKAIHNLIAAFAQVFPSGSDVILKIGGNGTERPRLEALAVELAVEDRVQFLGKLSRDQVLEEMSEASAYVLSSRYETFGVVVIEALALGKPVIATRCGGPESILREQDGLLVPPEDVQALAGAMKKIRSSYSSYDAVEIRSSCIARYSGQIIAERLSAVYSQVLAVSDGRRD